jgi:hypothetical protein
MATMELTQVYLEREQKKGLQARAKAHGTKFAEEVRRAVDAYLAGISPEDLRLLDEGTRKAERHLNEMADELDRINARLDAAFAQLSHTGLRGKASHVRGVGAPPVPRAAAARVRRKVPSTASRRTKGTK